MSEERVEGLLRIRNASQDIVGVAFLVKRGDGKPAYRALTCAHVVLAALGIHKDIDKNDHIRTSMPTQEIDLDFVYADTPDTPVKARVEAWYPQPAPHVDPHGALEDIAVLYLEPKYIPKNVQHYLLQTPDQFPGHEISVGFYGFPEGYDGVQGNTIDTTISKTSLALGWHKIATDEVVPGYSGAPVWAYQTNEKIVEKIEDKKIVGMIVANNTVKVKVLKNAVAVGTDKTVQIVPGQAVSGYMISTSILKQALPILSKNPYRGLDAFKKEDGKYFFGRESDANRLYERLGKKHPIAVVSGKSGSGKSSLVSAGLLPLLEEKDSGSWRTIAFRPQEEPFVELARGITDGLPESVKDGVVPKFTSPEELTTPLYALARLLKMEAEDLQIKMEAEDLQKTDGPVSGRNILHSLAEKLKKETRQSLLLVADQFEEAYTLSGKTSEMSKTSRIFTDYLIHSIKSQPSRLTIGLVLTIREDFLGTLLSDTKFTEVLEANIHTLKGIQDLDQVIKKPAEMKNVTLEPTLARRILDDLEHSNDQGSLDSFAKLPLLQFALTELWKEQHYQDGRYTLTESNYTTLRGAKGVLGEYAEKFFDKHDKTEQEALRRIFSEKLIVVRKRNDPLAKRVETKKSFSSEEWGLIRDLNDKRLVTIGRDKERKIETVEISHEALIGGWKRLRDWIDEDQDFLSWLTSLRQPLDKWYNANKDPDYLLIGKDLADAENKLKDENFGKRISGKAREFIESSIAERDRKEKQENARKTQQNVTIIATTLIAIFIALFIPRFFVLQNREQAAGSLAGQLSAQAQREIQGANSAVDVTKALLTLSEALHVYPSRLYREAFSSATQVLSNIPSYFYTSLQGHSGDVNSVALNLDGSVLASASADNTIILWDLGNPQSPAQLAPPLTEHSGPVRSVAFNYDGSVLASGSDDNTIILWDISNPQNSTQLAPPLTEHSGGVTSVAFNHDGSVLASASVDNTIILWDISNPQNSTQLAPPLTEHRADVASVAFSHDGSILASGSWDGTIILWDLSNPQSPAQLAPPLTGHSGGVESIAFNHNSSILASGSWDGAIILWDISGPQNPTQLAPSLTEHSDWVTSVAFNHDGSVLASGSDDNTIILWDISNPQNPTQLAPPLTGHGSNVESVVFNHDGSVLASGSDDSTIILWDITTRSPTQLTPPLTGYGINRSNVESVAFNHDDSILASGSRDNTITLWDITRSSTQLTPPLTGHSGGVESVAFNHDDSILASGSRDNTIILWDVSDPRNPTWLAPPLIKHSGDVESVAFNHDSSVLASGSDDSTIILWDISNPRNPARLAPPLAGHGSRVYSVAFNHDGSVLASASADGFILWDVSDPKNPSRITQPLEKWVYSVAFNHDSSVLASASADGLILWDISDPKNPSQLTQPSEEWIYSVAFNPDGSILASISADGLILWDISDLRNPSQITLTRAGEHSIQQVESAASSHGGYDLAFVSEDGNFELWRFRLRENSQPLEISSTIRIRIQTLVQTEPGPGHSDSVESVAFNHDGSILASASDDHTIILWDLSDPQNPTRLALPLTEHRADVASVAFNHDGSILASGSVDGTIILWDFNNPQDPTRLAPPLTEHSRGVASVAFNHDGSILASGSWDSTIILWDLNNPQNPTRLAPPLTEHSDSVTSVAFNHDSSILASGSVDGTIILWDLDVESLRDKTCRIAGYVTEEKWSEYFGSDQPYEHPCPQFPNSQRSLVDSVLVDNVLDTLQAWLPRWLLLED